MTEQDGIFNVPLHLHLGHKTPKKGDLGIEIEAEAKQGEPSPDVQWNANRLKMDKNPRYWVVKGDGSLRNGSEYVSRQPVSIEKLDDAMKEFVEFSEGTSFRQDSIRTSVHYHVNVSGMTLNQITAVIAGWWLIETPIVDTQGPTRVGNLFCLRVSDADHLVVDTLASISDDNVPLLGQTIGDNVKYAALNINALRRFGSLEFRFNKGTVNPKEITNWAQFLYNMVHLFASWGSPMEVVRRYEEYGAEYIMTQAVPFWLRKERPEGWKDAVNSNYSYAYMLAQRVKDEQEQPKVPTRECDSYFCHADPADAVYPFEEEKKKPHPDYGWRYMLQEFSLDEAVVPFAKMVKGPLRKRKLPSWMQAQPQVLTPQEVAAILNLNPQLNPLHDDDDDDENFHDMEPIDDDIEEHDEFN